MSENDRQRDEVDGGSTRRSALKMAGAAGATLLAGCTGGDGDGGSTEGGDDGGPIQIGLTRSTTGDFVFDSRKGFNGLKLWQRGVNEAGGLEVDGEQRRVELVTYDDRSSKQRVTRLYNRLCNEDDVDALFAPFSSTLTSAAAAVANTQNKYIMAWGAASIGIYEQGYNNLMSVETPTTKQPAGFLQSMENVGAQSVAVLHRDAAFTTSLAEAVEQQIGDTNMELVHMESHGGNTNTFTSTIEQIKQKDPDVFWPINYVGNNINIVNQMSSIGINFPWTQMVYGTNPQYYESLGSNALYFYGQHNIHPEIEKGVNLGLTVPEFFEQYSSTFGGNMPSFNSANGYSAAVIMGESMRRAGTARDTEALIEASLELSGETTVVNGEFSVHPERHHQDHSNYFAAQNQSAGGDSPYDNFEVIGPKEIAPPTADPVYPAPGLGEQ